MDYTEKLIRKPQILSLCTGYGGLDKGIERVLGPCQPVAYVEIEAYAVANLVSKMEAGKMVPAPVWTDLKTFPVDHFRGKVDIITGGYPCQPFSMAGRRKGTDDPRHLFPHIVRIIEAVRPLFCFFENVAGHLTLGFPEVYKSLRDLGYGVEAGLFTAAEVGAPHKRERLFILAYSESFGSCRNLRKLAFENAEIYKSKKQHKNKRRQSFNTSGQNHELADTDSRGVPGPGHELGNPSKIRQGRQDFAEDCKVEPKWPAPPKHSQHEWEPPRTIKPGMGGKTNGPGNRVDRLRLLGNGVVPQTAELAFRTLLEKFTL